MAEDKLSNEVKPDMSCPICIVWVAQANMKAREDAARAPGSHARGTWSTAQAHSMLAVGFWTHANRGDAPLCKHHEAQQRTLGALLEAPEGTAVTSGGES